MAPKKVAKFGSGSLVAFGSFNGFLMLWDWLTTGDSLMSLYSRIPAVYDVLNHPITPSLILGFGIVWLWWITRDDPKAVLLYGANYHKPLPQRKHPIVKISVASAFAALVVAVGYVSYHEGILTKSQSTVAESLPAPAPPTTAPTVPTPDPPPQVPTDPPPQPQSLPPADISLMKPGGVLSMIANVRGALGRHSNIRFVIAAPPENTTIQQELQAIISEACARATPQIHCPVDGVGDGVTPRPRKDQQGLTFQIQETVTPSQKLIMDNLPNVLSQWFIIHKNPEPPPEYILDREPKVETVFIQVGYGSPWKDKDARLRGGITQVDLDKLEGWDMPLKERLSQAAKKMTTLGRRGPGGPRPNQKGPVNLAQMKSSYQNVRAEVLTVLRDARQKKHLDTGNLETIAQDPQSEAEFTAIQTKLMQLSGDPLLDEN